MRKNPLVTDQYYHIFNRGVDKRDIFTTKKDIDRFVLSVKKFNTIKPIGSIRDKSGIVCMGEQNVLVSIVCYCFNPNHFHFVLKQEIDGGISEFLKRLLGGYTKYFNEVHHRSGALFQGRFKSNLISDEQYFLKVFPYVNVNYMIHDIPPEKSCLIVSSDKEYERMNFKIVSKKEAAILLEFYGDNLNFKEECLKVASLVREQREQFPIFLKEDFSIDV
ncbi:MAG: transposase [Candidatus Paceibacterota bacterium]